MGSGQSDGCVDRILSTVRAGERRQAKDVSIIEAIHRFHACHRELIGGERSRLITAQHVHCRGFVDCGKSRRKDA
jgi:hypothetical protein